eukprot:365400-Chlamydomonas_euryale.AAC.6
MAGILVCTWMFDGKVSGQPPCQTFSWQPMLRTHRCCAACEITPNPQIYIHSRDMIRAYASYCGTAVA